MLWKLSNTQQRFDLLQSTEGPLLFLLNLHHWPHSDYCFYYWCSILVNISLLYPLFSNNSILPILFTYHSHRVGSFLPYLSSPQSINKVHSHQVGSFLPYLWSTQSTNQVHSHQVGFFSSLPLINPIHQPGIFSTMKVACINLQHPLSVVLLYTMIIMIMNLRFCTQESL